MLVAGAASGVGGICVQAGEHLGVNVIGISRSAEKLDTLKRVGLDIGIPAIGGDYTNEVLGGTGNRGVDLAANLIGATSFPTASARSPSRAGWPSWVRGTLKTEVELEAAHGKRVQIFGVRQSA